jgi:ABC-type lipoprotein export system ATPase subunit
MPSSSQKRADRSLSARGLTKRFGPGPAQEALRGVDLELHAGDFISIVGRSGSGKSTLLALLGALTRPTQGTLLLDGEDVWSLPEPELARFRCRTIGFVFQFPSLLANLTALDNIAVPALLGGRLSAPHAYERARELIARVGLADRADAYPGTLSGGEQRRVAIARALINHPQILLADEPTSDLDKETEAGIMALLENLQREESFGLVLVIHNLALARHADRVYEMRHGRLALATEREIEASEPIPMSRPVPISREDEIFGSPDPLTVTWPQSLDGVASAIALAREPLNAPEPAEIGLGTSLLRTVRAFVIGGAAVFGVILAVDFAVGRYQANQVQKREAALAELADLALARLQTEVQSIADKGEGRYELAIALRNAGADKPIFVLSPDMHAFVQVGKTWQEVPLQPLDDAIRSVKKIEDTQIYRYQFEVLVKNYTQLLPNYMHMRFSNSMLISPSSQPKQDIFERKDNYYVYLKPFDISDEIVAKAMKFSGRPPVWIPMPPH